MSDPSLFSVSPDQAQARLAGFLALQPDAGIAIVPAAGRGSRSGLGLPKQYFALGSKTVLSRSVRVLSEFQGIAAVVVVLDPEDRYWMVSGTEESLADQQKVIAVPIGGKTRRDSVTAGLLLIQRAVSQLGADRNPWVLVHDAARPALPKARLEALWQELGRQKSPNDGAILALPLADTIKSASSIEPESAYVDRTISREGLWAAQTPQAFRLTALLKAYESAPEATDEAAAIEQLGLGSSISLVMGSSLNFKLTQPQDFQMMEAVMAQEESQSRSSGMPFAVGQGVDVHALVTGRPLIIGGVRIPYEKGLAGHSDADVLLHAITDAILGAAGLGDIGRHFPDSDPSFKDADSRMLLRNAVAKVHQKGWQVAQIDATVIAQAPKISPYATEMQSVIAQCCSVEPSRVNVKGKTTEHLGFAGRGEGIAAQSVALLIRSEV